MRAYCGIQASPVRIARKTPRTVKKPLTVSARSREKLGACHENPSRRRPNAFVRDHVSRRPRQDCDNVRRCPEPLDRTSAHGDEDGADTVTRSLAPISYANDTVRSSIARSTALPAPTNRTSLRFD